MIATIIIVSLAFYWFLKETNYLRVRLLCGVLFNDDDFESEFDGSDRVFLDDYELQAKEAFEDADYQFWLSKRYEPKYRYGGFPEIKLATIDPRYRWMQIEEDLTNRRQGNMLYQRGI